MRQLKRCIPPLQMLLVTSIIPRELGINIPPDVAPDIDKTGVLFRCCETQRWQSLMVKKNALFAGVILAITYSIKKAGARRLCCEHGRHRELINFVGISGALNGAAWRRAPTKLYAGSLFRQPSLLNRGVNLYIA